MSELILTDFLLARIAEDEAVAQGSSLDGGEWFSRDGDGFLSYGDFGWTVNGPGVETEDSDWGKSCADHIARHDPARVLAECESKRRIVEYLTVAIAEHDDASVISAYEDAVEMLATPYADHPDYRKEWKP